METRAAWWHCGHTGLAIACVLLGMFLTVVLGPMSAAVSGLTSTLFVEGGISKHAALCMGLLVMFLSTLLFFNSLMQNSGTREGRPVVLVAIGAGMLIGMGLGWIFIYPLLLA